MPDQYRVRLAQNHEFQRLLDIEKAASQLFDDTPYLLEVDQNSLSIELLQKQHQHDLVWVAVDVQDQPVGVAVVMLIEHYVYLHELSVDPDHGRRGLGTRLMQQVIQFAKTSGFKGVTLSTFCHVAWNAPFYAKLGFRAMAPEEISDRFTAIRVKEAEIGLPISERMLMILAF